MTSTETYITIKHQELTWAIDNNLKALEKVIRKNLEEVMKLKTEFKQQTQLELWAE